jgi:hypothetical protein
MRRFVLLLLTVRTTRKRNMKITIETESSYEAKVTIDDREMVFGLKNGGWSYRSGLKGKEEETTIGGMVAMKLMDILPDLLQGWMPECDNPKTGERWKLWEKLDEESADQVYERLS